MLCTRMVCLRLPVVEQKVGLFLTVGNIIFFIQSASRSPAGQVNPAQVSGSFDCFVKCSFVCLLVWLVGWLVGWFGCEVK